MSPRRRIVRTSLRGERRDPVAATQRLQFLGLDVPQVNRHDAARATRKALQAWVVMRCIQIKAQDLAGLPFVAGPRLPASYLELPATSPNSRMGQLLGVAPAPMLSAAVWWEWMLTQRYLTGQMASELDLNGDQVAALWPLTSSALKAVPTKGGAAWWTRFEYGRPDDPKRLAPDRVFYGWDPAPDDFRQPYSILQSAAIDVEVAVMVGRYNAAFLRNDARPAQVVVTEAFATQEDYDAFVAQFEGRHAGVDNAGRTAFIEADPDGALPSQAVTIQTLGLSQKDARILEQERAALEHVAMALGVPWSRLSAADRTYSNAGQESVDYWQGLAKDARKFGGEVNAQLADRLGGEVGWFDLSDVDALKVRPPVSAQEAATLVLGGIASAEEVRPWFGLAAELPAGLIPQPTPVSVQMDGRKIADRLASVTESLRRGSAQAERETPKPSGMPELPGVAIPVSAETNGEGERGAIPKRTATEDPARPSTRVTTEDERKAARAVEWRSFDSDMRNLEEAWTEAWQDYFAKQARSVVSQAVSKRSGNHDRLVAAAQARELRADVGLGGPFEPNEIQKWTDQAARLARLMDQQAATRSLSRINHQFGVSFDIKAPFIDDFITARANQLAGAVSDTTYAAIQQALVDGVAQGMSIDDLAAEVQHVFDVASSSRARTIARTEVIGAANGSHTLASQNLPNDVAAGRIWISTVDERTRDSHAEADGQVVSMVEPFMVGGEVLMYPGDANGAGDETINCRCTVGTLTPDEFAEMRRSVPGEVARVALRLVQPGHFDEARFRAALLAAA